MPELGDPLSEREIEVLQCVVGGASNKEIAATLVISQNTVKVHLRNIFMKLGASSRTEATTLALQQGLVTIPGSEAAAVSETAPTDVDPAPDTAVVQPASRRPFNRQAYLLLAILIVSGLAAGLIGLRAFSPGADPMPEPFEEEAVGNTHWLRSRPLPGGRASMAVAAVGLNLYLIGGETADGVVASVNAFDTTEYVWREVAAKPTAVADASAAVLFGEIYVPGGRMADGQPTNVVEAYSPANNAWRPIAALPQPIAGGLALSDGSFLYLFGGWNGERYLDTSYVYDPGTDSWRPLTSMPLSLAFAAGGALTGKLFVAGGYDGQSELQTCLSYESSAEEWATCPDMLLPRGGAAAAVLVNKLYVIGGGLLDGNRVAFSEFYDVNSSTWQVVNTPMLAEDPTWANLGVASVEVRIYALGGRRNGELSDNNLVYAPLVYQTFIPAAASSSDQ